VTTLFLVLLMSAPSVPEPPFAALTMRSLHARGRRPSQRAVNGLVNDG
jgi:hypothetical protein